MQPPGFRDIVGSIVGAVVLVGFGCLVWFMIHLIGTDDKSWARATNIFSSVEALAFGAGGFLFGKEIHRAQAVKAEARADSNAQDAKDANAKAATVQAKAESLAKVIQAKAKKAAASGTFESVRTPDGEAPPANADMQELAGLAEEIMRG